MKPTYEYKGRQLTINRLSCLPECTVSYQVIYNRIVTLGWTVEKAISTPPGPQKKKTKPKPEPEKMYLSAINKEKRDKELIRKEKLKQIFRKPVKPEYTYVYWVQKHGGIL